MNSFRDRPRAGSSRDGPRGTQQGPGFTAWLWCWGDAVEQGWEHKELGLRTGSQGSLSPSTIGKLEPKVPG